MVATSLSRRTVFPHYRVIPFEVERTAALIFKATALTKKSRQTVIAHKFIGSASMRLAL